MSQAVLVCWRAKGAGETPVPKASAKQFFGELSSNVFPIEFCKTPPVVIEDHSMFAGVFNPKATVGFCERCFFLGAIQSGDDWHEFGGNDINGSYSIFRTNDNEIELVTDAVASRTIWYYFDDTIFIASTSQAAITYVLGSFEPNEELLTWMVSNGTLGPGSCGWDRRVRRIEPDTIICVNRKTWEIKAKQAPIYFSVSEGSEEEKREALEGAVRIAMQTISLPHKDWSILLSGGYDSRAIISLLENPHEYRTVSWGMAAHRNEHRTDASVADMLSKEFGTLHSFMELDATDAVPQSIGDAENLISNFLQIGDGRSDNISGYMDNFSVWRALSRAGVQGVVRGDEGFGWIESQTESQVRLSLGVALWSDFVNVPSLKSFGFAQDQKLPAELERQNDETLDSWRDRLYHTYRLPVALAALNDLKTPFVEIANPLLSRNIIKITRGLSDSQRTDKSLFRQIVHEVSPHIPFAKHESTLTLDGALRLPAVAGYLQEMLDVDGDRCLLPSRFLHFAQSGISSEVLTDTLKKNRLRSTLRGLLPAKAKNWLQSNFVGTRLDGNIIAFRCVIINLMQNRLSGISQLGAGRLFNRDGRGEVPDE
ncbi:asparagine synthase-related protein [Roseovarius sp. ZX-A-9]|uniref:asparagine synthase-related protein n=1 Tax=Roseovarius sp. ZX-A-9 TaxID=3014783 RepID=UPI00232D7D8F|nr:asparagine synthase-related protein [Roseovarius sp. ZX-A-9]